MALVTPGNATTNVFTQDASVPLGGVTKFAFMTRLKFISGGSIFDYFKVSNEGYIRRQSATELKIQLRTIAEIKSLTLPGVFTAGDMVNVFVTVDCDAGEGKAYVAGVQSGATQALTGATLRTQSTKYTITGNDTDGQDSSVVDSAEWVGSIPSEANIASFETGLALLDFASPPTHSCQPVGDGSTYIATLTDLSGTNDMSHTQGPTTVDNFPFATPAPVTGPTLTGPASAQEGDAINAIGTGLTSATLDLITTVGGHVGAQVTTGVPTDTLWPYTVNPKTGVPFSVVPIQAAGVTLWVTEQRATDGTSATSTMTIAAKTNETVIQGMIATSNTTPGESIFGTNVLAMEDNLQANAPTLVDGVTITWIADGTFTVDINQAISFNIDFFSPSNSEWQSITLNVSAAGVISVGSANTRLSIGIGIGI